MTNIAAFETNTAIRDPGAKLKGELAFHADLVIVAIGENVPPLDTDDAKAAFQANLVKLPTALKSNGQPGSFRFGRTRPGTPFSVRRARPSVVSLWTSAPANAPRSERAVARAGVAGHPGDRGMKAIADALFAAIPRALPDAH